MTLRRQLLIGITLLFTLIFLGIFAENLHSMRTYVEQQLASHAQDAATSLTFPLSRALAKDDLVLAETIIDAMVDRGYFQSIVVYSVDGQVLVQRAMPTKIEGIPSWFVSFVHLQPPPGQSLLSGGWHQLGRVIVVSQPVFAYKQLWTSMLVTIAWLGIMYISALLLVVLLLKIILSPLHAIEQAAVAISHKRFEMISLRPRAREFSRVVRAMNEMIKRIAGFLDAEEKRAEGFRKEAYQDGVTGLDNRRSFDLRLGQLLSGDDTFTGGVLLAIDIDGLKEFNTRHGYRAGDELLAALAESFRSVLKDQAIMISRISGASIAAIVLEQPEEVVEALAKQLQHAITEVFLELGITDLAYGIGVAVFHGGEGRPQLLTRLDLATEAARHFGGSRLQIRKPSVGTSEGLGSMGWRQLIIDALVSSRWVLYAQPVVELINQSVIHSEVVARLAINNNELVPAAQFLPMASRHQLLPDVERALLEAAINVLAKRKGDLPLALNITFDGLLSGPGALESLSERIVSGAGANASLLSFEVSEFNFLTHLEQGMAVAECVRRHGCKFGIDQFGFDSRALQAIRKVPPDYIKLDGGLLRDSADNEKVYELVQSIVQLAQSLGVLVIAQGIESENMLALLREMGIEGGQGYYFGHPDLL